MKHLILVCGLILMSAGLYYAQNKKVIALNKNSEIASINVISENAEYKGKKCLKVLEKGESSEVRFVEINNPEFRNGTIELEIAGKPAANAGAQARGFVGIAFRIDQDHSKFECFYLRPTNGRAEDQLRRNHSVQYISYPDYPWYKLRKDHPGKYESYADLVPGEWTKVKITVQGEKAKLFVHGNSQPTLIVNDLKHGERNGSIGLWIGPGTEAYFANLQVSNSDLK